MSEPFDLEALAADVAAAAAARRARGDYPPGLEEELDEHYRIVTGHQGSWAVDALGAVDSFASRPSLSVPSGIDTSSSIRGGARLHRVIGATVVRHQAALVEQLNDVFLALSATLRAMATALDPQATIEGEITGRLDAIEGRLAELQRRVNDG